MLQVLDVTTDCCYFLIKAAWRDPVWALGIAVMGGEDLQYE